MSGKRRAAGPAVKKGAPKRPRRTRKQKVLRVVRWLGVTGLVLALLAVGAFVVLYRAIDIPDPNKEFETQTSFVYYADGKTEVGSFATQNRDSIPIKEMPESLQNAVVAAENRSFWTDKGIDPKGILRAAFSNAQGNAQQGASTITQQYVKILYLTQERSYKRKIKEAILSLKIQREQSKSQILEGYLNTIYFGRGAYGVQAAARAFFDKNARSLTLKESAVLASVLNNPSDMDPANGKEERARLKARYDWVLDGMAEAGDITARQADRAKRRLPRFPEIQAESRYGGQRGHMLTLVRGELKRLGYTDEQIDGGGLRVTTTFTEKDMKAAAEGVAEARPDGLGDKELHVGVASVEPGTGAVRGFYGGQDYLQSQINWAVAGGQGGSTLKPFELVAAIRDGFSLKDTFDGNSPYDLPDGTNVENQGNTSYGTVSMLKATQDSINTAFIDMALGMEDGPAKILQAMRDMGLPPAERTSKIQGFPDQTPGLQPNIGVALGSATVSPINMANAYATLAAGGEAAQPYIIEKVEEADGRVSYNHKVQTRDAVEPDIAADVSYALQQVVQAGSGTAALELGRPAAGKTGTSTNDEGDVVSSWFTGYTPQLATSVVYVRGKGAEPLDGYLEPFFGGTYPAQTWTAVMQRAMAGVEVEEFPPPAYVDGEAPSSGHEPAPPPPTKTRSEKPTPSNTPSQTPTQTPTQSPTQTPTETPTESCGLLGCETPTNSPSPSDTPSTPAGGQSGGARGMRGRRRTPADRAA
ncbi:transglycosylase domain-containing protein [Nocardioides hungaricus]